MKNNERLKNQGVWVKNKLFSLKDKKIEKGFSEFFTAQREIENFRKSQIKFVFFRT
jgi:hypothetical protein